MVGGLLCMVNVEMTFSKFMGQLSCCRSNKQYKIIFNTINKSFRPGKNTADIFEELHRLYFDNGKNA